MHGENIKLNVYTFSDIDQRIFLLRNLRFLWRWLRRLRTVIAVFWNESM